MGISTLQSYQGADFEAIGLNRSLTEKYFTGTLRESRNRMNACSRSAHEASVCDAARTNPNGLRVAANISIEFAASGTN